MMIKIFFSATAMLFVIISCSNRNKPLEEKSIKKDHAVSTSNSIPVNDKAHLFDNEKELKLPIRINAYGNRFWDSENVLQRDNKKLVLDLLKSKNLITANRDGFTEKRLYLYGYKRISGDLSLEIFGFGWNDMSMTDNVDYKVYLFVHGNNDSILDFMEISNAFNYDNKLEYSEFYMNDKNEFTITRYDFLKNKQVGNRQIPEIVKLIPVSYSINAEGKILKKKDGTPLTVKSNLKSDYCDFTGIFDVEHLKDTDYWNIW